MLPVPPTVPPHPFPAASWGAGLGPGAVLSELTDLPCPSCLLEEEVELPGLARLPIPSLPCPRSSGAWCPTKASLSLQDPQFQKKESTGNQDAYLHHTRPWAPL